MYQILSTTHAVPLKTSFFSILNLRDVGGHAHSHKAIVSGKEDSGTQVFLLSLSWGSLHCVTWPLSEEQMRNTFIELLFSQVKFQRASAVMNKNIFVFPPAPVLRFSGPGLQSSKSRSGNLMFISDKPELKNKTKQKKVRNSYKCGYSQLPIWFFLSTWRNNL